MNYADEALAAELDLPVRRWGGNATTRYNWQTDVHNVGSDWYFENIPDADSGPLARRLDLRSVRRTGSAHGNQNDHDRAADRLDAEDAA